jgi:hypothetical protein
MTTTQPATRSESRALDVLQRALKEAGIEVVGQHRADLLKHFVAALRSDDMTIHFHRHDQAAINRTYRSGAICAYFAEHTSGEAFIAWKNRRDVFFDCAGRMQLELDQVGQ